MTTSPSSPASSSSNTTSLPAGSWSIDPASTTVTITVKKMKIITVPATLSVTSGTIGIADGKVAEVDVVADASSYSSPNKKRNEHVIGADFLDASQHPTITYSVSAVQNIGDDAQIEGEVTIKGRSARVTFDVTDVRVDGDSATFAATAVVDRLDLGIDKMPAFVIGRDLDIAIAATAHRAP